MQTRWPVYMASMLLANGFGAILAYGFIRYGLPIRTTDPTPAYLRQNFILFSVTLAIGGLISLGASAVMLRPVVRWQLRGGAPTKSEQMAALHAPLRQSIVHLFLWIIGGAIIAIQIIAVAPELAAAVVITVCMAATIVFGFSYMLGERILRPVAADALASGDFDRTLTPGVGTRMMLTWGLGTLAPSIGIVLLCVTQLTTQLEFSSDSLALAILLLCVLVVLQALALSMLTGASISDPVQQLTTAIAEVQSGVDDVQVEVFDGSEIGRLQVGFNRMMEESSERQALQELFGRHVGEDVARRALRYGTELAGRPASSRCCSSTWSARPPPPRSVRHRKS